MGLFVSTVQDSGMTLVVTLVKHNGDEFRPGTGWQTAGTSTFANRKITLTGGSSDKVSWYTTAEITGLGDDGYVWILVHNDGDSDQVIAASQTYIWSGVEITPADVLSISHDSTAADNAELMFDGTGYAGGTQKLGVDVVQISGDTTAANNCELAFDGTGFGFTGCTMPTTTTVTNMVTANTIQISGDTTAADNAELAFDGTGYAFTNCVMPTTTTVTNAVTTGTISANAITASALATDAVAEIADAVWDELQSGHLAAGSFGASAQVTRAGTAQAGGASTITLDASASASNNTYVGLSIRIVSGTGLGETNDITAYVGATKVATVGTAWTTQPDSTSQFIIEPEGSHELSADGFDNIVVEAGGITLNARQAISIIASGVAGECSGAASTSMTYKAAGDSATTRIAVTVDEDGNRSAMTISPPA